MLTMDYLYEFVMLAKIGKFSDAAEELFISQSTLSKHIALLEKELDISLFDRSTHHVKLTPAGISLLPYANRMVDLGNEIDTVVLRQKTDLKKFQLTAASSPVVPLNWFSFLMSEYTARYQDCKLHIRSSGSAAELWKLLHENKADIAVTYTNDLFLSDEFECVPYAHDRLSAVLPISHKSAMSPSVTLQELQCEVFAQVGKMSILETFLSSSQRATLEFHPIVDFTVDTTMQMLNLVRFGLAAGILSHQAVKHFSDSGISIVPIAPEIPCDVWICWKRETENENLARFESFVREKAHLYTE